MLNRYKRIKMTCSGSTVIAGYPLYDPVTYTAPRQGSEFATAPSGIEDAWIVADEEVLKASIRFIPATASLSPSGSGWNEWQTFLNKAREKHTITFYPDQTAGTTVICFLSEPIGKDGIAPDDDDSTYRLDIVLRASGSQEFTGY